MKDKQISKLDGRSADIKLEQIKNLKSIFPQVVQDGKVDFDALKLALADEIEANGQSYGLSWAGKAEVYRHIQESTAATLKPDKKQSLDFDTTENLFIEGDNLEVLKVLQRSYYGKVKMIYIDPPYNTGSDSFIYPDRFKEEREEYEQRAGIKDEEGLLTKDGFWRKNSKDTGHFHSNWLSMMYPRLFLARNLLREDGVIFVSIDDNEVHNLRMIMNEIFGEENFVANIVWQKKQSPQNDAIYLSDMHDHIVVYAKRTKEIRSDTNGWQRNLFGRGEEQEARFKNPDNDPKGPWISVDYTCNKNSDERPNLYYPINNPNTGKDIWPSKQRVWRYERTTHERNVKEGRVWWGEDGENFPRLKRYRSEVQEGIVPSTWWDRKFAGDNQQSKREIRALFNEGFDTFDTPKPILLIRRILELGMNSDEDDIVLDFFAGSCTTAHAVMQLNAEDGGNRKFICVQLAEPCDEENEAFKAGYKNIADIGRERIRRAAKKIKEENRGKLDFDGKKLDLGFKSFKLSDSSFKQWRENIKTGGELKEHLKMFVDNKKADAKPEDMLYEIILKHSRFDLNVKVEQNSFDGIDYYSLTTEHTESTEKEEVRRGLTQINADSETNKNVTTKDTKNAKENNGEIEIICLAEKVTKKFIDKMIKEKPEKFTCLDAAFKDNDQLKTNTALQMDAEKIEFKVI